MDQHPKYVRAYKNYAEALYARYNEMFPQHELGNTPERFFEKIAGYDPSGSAKAEGQKYQYLDWICRNLLKSEVRPQDVYKIRDDLILFSRKKSKLEQKNLDAYSVEQLSDAMFPYLEELQAPTSAEQKRLERVQAEEESQILYDGKVGKIVLPHTIEASQFWGRGTKWCISATKADNFFSKYYEEGESPILMFLPIGSSEKFAFNRIDGSIRNSKDLEVYIIPQSLRDIVLEGMKESVTGEVLRTSSPQVISTFQDMLLSMESFYPEVLKSVGDEELSSGVRPADVMRRIVDINQDMDWWTVNDGQQTFLPLFKSLRVLREVVGLEDSEKRGLSGILRNSTLPKALAEEISRQFAFADEDMADRECFLDLYHQYAAQWNKTEEWLGETGVDLVDIEETVARRLLSCIPENFWEDSGFTTSVLNSFGGLFPDMLKSNPDFMRYPEAVLSLVQKIGMENFEIVPLFLAEVPHVWQTAPNGKSFIEQALPPALPDLHLVADFYKAARQGGVDDFSALAERLAHHFPEGFLERDDLEIAAFDMEGVDLSDVFERTIEHHPDWFGDVPPKLQTVPMAVRAINHNPDSLVDVNVAFLKAANRPEEFAQAYQKLSDGRNKTGLAPYFANHLV